MNRIVTKIFRLRTNEDHYVEFQAGLDRFRFEFRWSQANEKWVLSVYKNTELKVCSYFIVWALYNLLDPFIHMKLGSLQAVVDDREETDTGSHIYKEISKDNIKDAVFRWDYETV